MTFVSRFDYVLGYLKLMTSHEYALGSVQTCEREPMSTTGTWSFDTRMALHSLWPLAYNNPPSARVGGKNCSLSLVFPSPNMSVEVPSSSRSPSRGLRQSFSEQISDMKTKLVRALSSERPSPNYDGSSQYSRLGEDMRPVERSLSRGRESVVSVIWSRWVRQHASVIDLSWAGRP
ncbi:hypothetical protein BDM02DRAFT_2776258 [Thelephora ganbajun]|uniref:Uncharacterized protein n=1 Tax=Thelephora ganbajun TaxID=370292 RepID=A0ACB6ZSF1_THEGA|nr:hypothetical protein BDM02DRAFT_2776258 [Thelephora ganbajun]